MTLQSSSSHTTPPQGLPVEPVPPDAGMTGSSSPSAVREAEAQLILRHTHLKEALPQLEYDAKDYADRLRTAKVEMEQIVRLLRAHERLKNPIRRKK